MWRRLALACALMTLLVSTIASGAVAQVGTSGGDRPPPGFRALVRSQAETFRLPGDVIPLWIAHLANGLTQTRYQQMIGRYAVLGGQFTVLQSGRGEIVAVIGSHFPRLSPSTSARLGGRDAKQIAQGRVGRAGRWLVRPMIDPTDGHLFYEVENRRFDRRWIHWIDASSGAVRNVYDAIAEGTGTGVKADAKTLDTTAEGAGFVLVSSDGRQETYDARNRQGPTAQPGVLFADDDDVWDLAGTSSPGHPAGVDAHYYADVVDDFYADAFGRDSLDDQGMVLVSTAHFGRRYNNAFWNGSQMVYGDGDGSLFRELSGGLDVVGHELTHGVTQFTSNLIYQGESGALNEAFSDMMGNAVEFYADHEGLDPSVAPDFLLGEDIMLAPDTEPGIRNMGDPHEDGQPDHYSEFVVTRQDNGGVHTNSGIPNHAFYLLTSGGRNAGCGGSVSDHTHAADCGVNVSGIGVDDATQIFFTGLTSLPQNANMCSARLATLATASVYEGGAHLANTAAAWNAVGVGSGCAPAPPPPPCGDEDAAIPFGSDRPYANDQDCTWTYDHGTANFRLRFSRLNVEAGFDFLFVIDGNGGVVHQITGNHRGFTTDCITTSVVDVRLVTDPLVVRPGFEVDAALPC